MAQPRCRHKAAGYVCWPAGTPTRGQSHASTRCCARPACIENAAQWVQGITGNRGEFHTFEVTR